MIEEIKKEYLLVREELMRVKGQWLLQQIKDILTRRDEYLEKLRKKETFKFETLEPCDSINVASCFCGPELKKYEQMWISFFQNTDEYADYTVNITLTPNTKTVSVYIGNDSPVTYEELQAAITEVLTDYTFEIR